MPAALTEPEIIVGVVGCSAVVEAYPLGPAMMQRLERRLAEVPGARAENMTWGPIHIVQQYQDEGGPRPARLVLIGYASVSTGPGRVTAHRWTGGVLSDAAVQERVHEAVTGVVDLENTLMIGERFGIWPPECHTVEADIPADTFGHMVMAESAGRDGDAALTALLGFSPARMVDEVIAAAVDLAANGPAARTDVTPKGAGDLVPPVSFMRDRAAAV